MTDLFSEAQSVVKSICKVKGIAKVEIVAWKDGTLTAKAILKFKKLENGHFESYPGFSLKVFKNKIMHATSPYLAIITDQPKKSYKKQGPLNVQLGYDKRSITLEVDVTRRKIAA